jgi:hypothetical protein
MADPRRLREILGFGYGAPSPAMSALQPFHAGVDPAYMPQDVVTESPGDGPSSYVRSGLESLLGLFAPSDRAAAETAGKLNAVADFNPLQGAYDIGKGIGDAVQGGDKLSLAMSMIPGKAEEGVAPLVKAAQKKLKAYHATRNDFERFGPAPEYRGSTYLALTPEGAKKGSTGGAQDFPDVGDRRPQRLLEVELPDEGIQGLHWTPKEREWFDSMPDRIEGDEALNAAFEGQPNNGSISWDDIYEPRQIGDRLYEYIKKPPKTYSLDEVVKTNRDIYGGQLPGYQDRDVEAAKRLREAGMKGYLLNDEAGVSIAHIDPETLEIVPAVKAAQKGIRAYHGSPHGFEKFDISKIGTGEGAQAYGHGLYFADNEKVAQQYRDALAPHSATLDGKTLDTPGEYWGAHDALEQDDWRKAKALDYYSKQSGPAEERLRATRDWYRDQPDMVAAIDALDLGTKSRGHMYEVNINADPDAFLDWDKPLSEQPGMLEKLAGREGMHEITPDLTGQGAYFRANRMAYPIKGEDGRWGPGGATYEESLALAGGDPKRVNRMMNGLPADKRQALEQAGIPGIKYLDAGSRSGGEGSRNYVVFSDEIIDIVKKYGIAGALGAGLITQQMADQLEAQQGGGQS